MITTEQIAAVLDHPVLDTSGRKIGDAKRVFVDDTSGQPGWAAVRTGRLGGETFVPIRDAQLVDDHLEVPYPKAQVMDAPHPRIEPGGHLSRAQEQELGRHYGIAGGAAGDAEQRATGETVGAAGAAAGTRSGNVDPGATAATGRAEERDLTDETGAMTRSEERMHVRTERYASGEARLHKYVVTEEVEQTVPVRHEKVRIVREPIEAGTTTQTKAQSEFAEAEQTVTLHAERPVVETETVAVERVRLVPEEETEQQTIKGTVRKERIETHLPDEEPGNLS
ncbi:YsnF/AvaK domain-containing protein [Streptomyces sp. MS2.AVA.5]|uniref:YsnF/AvaK domain-containing protein n=1 Tax=Streptomyces achmelvichensis TaxID=3134111 RepID=A0ACC6PN86_9ACTN